MTSFEEGAAQPEEQRLGAYLDAEVVPVDDAQAAIANIKRSIEIDAVSEMLSAQGVEYPTLRACGYIETREPVFLDLNIDDHLIFCFYHALHGEKTHSIALCD